MASQDWFDKDFYKVLGVSKDVSQSELKKTYRKLARQYHPDSNPGDAKAEAKFKEISEAYSVLSDEEQRKEYDQVRAMGSGARFTAPGGAGNGGFEDVFGSMFNQGGRGQSYTFQQGGGGQYDDLLGGLFGNGRFGQSTGGYRGYGGPTPGQDVSASTTIDFQTAVTGETVHLTVDGETVKVRIPAGVTDKQRIRVPRKGRPSPDGGERGDLYLTVTVRKHPVFERDGLHLRVNVPVTFAEATLGATIEVPTLSGDVVRLKVAPGTPSGRVLRVKGRGVATKKGTGDLLATVQVVVPSHLTKAGEEALKAFEQTLPDENPRDELLAKAKASAR
ncbi:DnaJ C-terminal domain-containing protein [Humibacter ginsenosidimutans]|uniref:J domain-containing protein n=1 Tax=Humibacter ginsenosidimutans TaxID=2599293 RepID=A0A5B8M5M3_9MICO|nr:DnaJ C-terminal domain-containing protein [Humibacter ginsenosidimutans]QDZ15379.1 J domain-containing protein [Humibacter ginsenosidimutans]